MSLEIETKEGQLRGEQAEHARVLTRLESLPVNDETKAIVQRYVNGELTIEELDASISWFLASRHRAGLP